jgi:hypothetical protein
MAICSLNSLIWDHPTKLLDEGAEENDCKTNQAGITEEKDENQNFTENKDHRDTAGSALAQRAACLY